MVKLYIYELIWYHIDLVFWISKFRSVVGYLFNCSMHGHSLLTPGEAVLALGSWEFSIKINKRLESSDFWSFDRHEDTLTFSIIGHHSPLFGGFEPWCFAALRVNLRPWAGRIQWHAPPLKLDMAVTWCNLVELTSLVFMQRSQASKNIHAIILM
jgi:hypothetical protein